MLELRTVAIALTLVAASQLPFAQPNRLMVDLHGWKSRANRFTQIVRTLPTAPKEICGILRVENDLINGIAEDQANLLGPSEMVGESYVEYYYELFEACLVAAEAGYDPGFVELARGAFEPGSDAANRLLSHAELVLPAVLSESHSSASVGRLNAILYLHDIRTNYSERLSAEQIRQIQAAMERLSGDAVEDVAKAANRSIDDARKRAWIVAMRTWAAPVVLVFILVWLMSRRPARKRS